MDREKYKNYLLSPEWKMFRKKVFEHYGKKCSKCPRTKQLKDTRFEFGPRKRKKKKKNKQVVKVKNYKPIKTD